MLNVQRNRSRHLSHLALFNEERVSWDQCTIRVTTVIWCGQRDNHVTGQEGESPDEATESMSRGKREKYLTMQERESCDEVRESRGKCLVWRESSYEGRDRFMWRGKRQIHVTRLERESWDEARERVVWWGKRITTQVPEVCRSLFLPRGSRGTLQCVAVCCSVLQCVAACCNLPRGKCLISRGKRLTKFDDERELARGKKIDLPNWSRYLKFNPDKIEIEKFWNREIDRRILLCASIP